MPNVKRRLDLRGSLIARQRTIQEYLDRFTKSVAEEEREVPSADDLPATEPDPVAITRTGQFSRERHIIEERLSQLERREPIICANCEEPIPMARLRAVPTATRCWPCQTREERTDPKIRLLPSYAR
jgi:RNA polymerase-binding transcription factor DksA